MSNSPAPMMTKPAERNCPAASRTAATMLMTSPRNVRTLGWIFESASPWTMSRITLSHAMPIARVYVMPCGPSRFYLETESCGDIVDGNQLDNFHLADTIGNLHFHGIAHLLADQPAANWRSSGDASLGDVGVFAGDQAVSDLLILGEIQHRDRGAEAHAVARDARHIHHRQL